MASSVDDIRLAGLVDTDGQHVRSLASQYGIPIWATTLDDIVGEVDGVVLATPPHARSALAKQAFASGMHVLCEKPMANSSRECREIISNANTASRALTGAHTYRYFPNRIYARSLFRSGRLGHLISGNIEQGHPHGWVARTAYTFRKQYVLGGILFNEGVHVLDMLLWFFGVPQNVHYFDDSLGGLESNVRLSLHYFHEATINLRFSRTCSLANRAELRFENGCLSFGLYDMANLKLVGNNGEVLRLILGQDEWDFRKAVESQLCDFVSAATAGSATQVPGDAGLAVIELIEACYRIKTQRPRPRETPLPGMTW